MNATKRIRSDEWKKQNAISCRAYKKRRGRSFFREKEKAYREKNYIKTIFWCRRSIAKSERVEFTIKFEDLVVPLVCPVLGITLDLSGAPRAGGVAADNSPSIDRINPERGYVAGNVAIISWLANRLKSNGSADQHEAIAKYQRANS